MVPKVSLTRHSCAMPIDVENYRLLAGDELIDEILDIGRRLKGIRICHINSTAFGDGVAELLSRHLPLVQALGLSADWRIIHAAPEFLGVTKAFHNALQGAEYDLKKPQQALYLAVNEQGAKSLPQEYDLFIVHDTQPAAIRHFAASERNKWIWWCHIDLSESNPVAGEFFQPYIEEYDGLIFSKAEFLLPELRLKHLALIPPAIDPLASKNMKIPLDLCKRAISDSGIDVSRPLLLQVSRFDPWKDPLGVIEAYRLVKKDFPDVQLALIGGMAGDDPEGWDLFEQVEEEAAKDPDVFVFTNLAGTGNMEVNVFQRGCDVVIQKSSREGFGLGVSEAFWKEKPVVAGKAGGIPMQFPEGFDDYLIESLEECAKRVKHLLKHTGERGEFGRAGREHVRQNFLLPRLLRDELKLIEEIVG